MVENYLKIVRKVGKNFFIKEMKSVENYMKSDKTGVKVKNKWCFCKCCNCLRVKIKFCLFYLNSNRGVC